MPLNELTLIEFPTLWEGKPLAEYTRKELEEIIDTLGETIRKTSQEHLHELEVLGGG